MESRTVLEPHHYGLLCEQLVPCLSDWETIAINLGFKSYEIAKIKSDMHLTLHDSHMYEVVEKWLQWAPGDGRGSQDMATLEALQSALNRANYARIKLTLAGGFWDDITLFSWES